MSEEWGPWIEHDGKGFPLARGQVAHLIYRSGDEEITIVGLFRGGEPDVVGSSWHWGAGWDEIIRYRIRKPRGLTILEGLLENLPEEVGA
jgi:hypothetical protein